MPLPKRKISRSLLLAGVMVSLVLHGLGAAHAGDTTGTPGTSVNAGETGSTVNILWRAPSRQSVSIQKQLNFDGSVTADSSTQVDGRSPALIYILAGIVSVDMLIKTLLSAYKDIRYGGIIVRRGDNGGLLIANDKKLPGGTILVDQGAQGVQLLNAKSQPGSAELLQAVTPLLK